MHSSNAEDVLFDQVIGSIEDIIMGLYSHLIKLFEKFKKKNFFFKEPKFQEIQDDFMNKNYKHFEDNDENKLIYTTVHNEYVSIFSNVTFLI